ncbi:MAG TPA: PKD domain-containing protein, partial [bacterium]|nr:PKD domain-containing protein [bacterium]
LLALLAALGCGRSTSEPTAAGASPEDPTALPQVALDPVSDLPALSDGFHQQGALGVYWLVRDPTDPLKARLELDRSLAAATQGNLFLLSVRPFLGPQHLTLQGGSAGGDNTTNYTFRFTHPYAMPADLNPPATAMKRVDLFIFDVNLTLMVAGNSQFFGNTVRTNLDAFPDADGYRMVGPLVSLAPLGISNGTNVFPYRLISSNNPLAPTGNYDVTGGWSYSNFRTPTGYDVVPQGASVTTTIRIANSIPTPLPLVVFAKYMDPRGGTTSTQKRANRLPSATDPTKCRYFLPEACGDLQRITVNPTSGSLYDNSSIESMTLTATVLDWDQSAMRASTFPNHSAVTQVSENSYPTFVAASFPALQAASDFTGSVSATGQGSAKQNATVQVQVRNTDRSFTAAPGGTVVKGLIKLRDAQDNGAPDPTLLNEALVVQSKPSWYEPSTRFQVARLTVLPGTGAAPNLTGVTPSPAAGAPGASLTLGAVNSGGAVTTWSWNFGGGATPNTSTVANPVVTLGSTGNYVASVTGANAGGSSTYNFTLTVNAAAPNITGVTPNPPNGNAGASLTFAATNTGGAVTNWSWNFGGGASPNTSTAAGPVVTLGSAGSYAASVTGTNASGSSTFNFTLTVTASSVPVITGVSPLTANALRASAIGATASGSPTSWNWNFGTAGTPSTSNAASPTITWGAPGTYNCSVTATNASGTSAPYNFQVTVNPKLIGLRLAVITNGSTYPPQLYGMSGGWNLTSVQNWINTYFNPQFANTGVRIDPAQITLVPTNNPALFNIDTNSEYNQLWSLVLGQSSAKLNAYVINSIPFDPGVAGAMTDSSSGCNNNNVSRGCWIAVFQDLNDSVVLPHELGHVMNLPHVRTGTPINANNYNLMSYWTFSTALGSNVTREDSSWCMLWTGNPHNQFTVANNWVWQYLP